MKLARRLNLGTVFAAAPLLLGLSSPALAGHGEAIVQVYNATGILNTGGAFSVSGGLNATYFADAGLEIASQLTVGLPQGFTFASVPALESRGTVFGTFAAVSGTVVSGGVGSSFVTFQLNGNVIAGNSLVLIGAGTGTAFNVANGIALAQPSREPFAITFQASGNGMALRNDPVPVSVPAFRSMLGVSLTLQTKENSIDLTPPSLGANFTPAGRTTANAVYLGSVEFHADGDALNADASPFTLGPADASILTVHGSFRHYSKAYLDPAEGVCGTSLPAGAISGSVSATALTFAAVLPQQAYGLCLVADGIHLLDAIPAERIRVALGRSFRFGPTQVVDHSELSYSGGVVPPRLTFITGSDAGYSSLVSITNPGDTTATIFVVAQPFTGGPPLTGTLGNLAPGAGQVFTEAQIGTATGLTLANSGQRAVIQVIGVGANDLTANSLLVNPGGVVDNVR